MKKIILLILASLTFLAAEDVKIKSAGTDADDGVVFKNSIDSTLVDIDGTGVVNIKGIPSAGATLRLFEAFGNGANYLQLNPGVSLTENATWNLSHAGGSGNMFLGYESGSAVLSSGAANVGLGYNAAKALTSGVRNVALGYKALTAGTSANYNITIGYQAGDVLTTGQKNIIIGSDADPSAASGENQVVIGYEAVGTADNQVVLGNSSTTQWVPGSADATDLGSASAEFNDLYLGDGAVVNLGVDQDVSLTHIADTGVRLSGSSQLQFRDAALNVSSSADGQLDVDADAELELVAPIVDINASTEVNISGELKVGGRIATGSDGAGVDVVLYSNTSGDDFTWDASEEKLIITGTNGQDALTIADGNVTVSDNVIANAFSGDGSALTGIQASALGTLPGASPIVLEGETADGFETTVTVTDPTADRTITLPDGTGTLSLTDATETLSNKTLIGPVVAGSENSSGSLHIYADDGDDDNDKWRLETANGGSMTIDSKQTGSWSTLMTMDNSGNAAIAGDVTVTGNDVTFGNGESISNGTDGTVAITATTTTTSGALTATGAVTGGSLTDGTATISSGAVSGVASLAVDNVKIDGATIGHTDDTDLMTLANGTLTVAGTVAAAAHTSGTMTATGAVTGGSFTDGTATISSGVASGLTTVTASGLVSGGSLDIDDVVVDGTTIGHTDDTDLMTLTSGTLTVAGTVAATTLTGDGSGITGVSASSIKADDVSAGDAAVTISTTSGAVNITPASGSAIVLDGTINVDAGVVTGATSVTSAAFVASTSLDVTGATGIILQNDETITNSTDGTVTIGGTVAAGTGSATGVVQSNGDFDLTLQTGNSNTGTITITDGANGNIAITPNGTGEVDISKVDIDGGTIDGTPIGANSASTGAFSTITASGALTASGAVTGGSFTDGTATISSGAASGLTTVTASGLVSGGSLDIDDVVVDGTTIGHTDDTDLMILTSGTLTVAGTVAATTLTGDGSGITGVSASAIKADDVSAGDAAVTISTTVGAVNITPASGSAIVLDGTINVDAGVVTGATSVTSAAFVASTSLDVTGSTGIILQNDETITNSTDGTVLVTAPITTLSGDLTVTGNDITFGNGESISNGTDGTVAITATTTTTSGALTASGAVTGGSLTDGTATISSGAVSGVASLAVDNVKIDGTTIGHADDTDLMTLTSGTLTVAGTVAATTLTGDGSGITGVSASAIKADDVSAGDAAVTISTTVGAVNITPASGSAIVLDGTINVDAGVVTGATSVTSAAFVASTSLDVTGSTGIILQNDETITNSTDGTVLVTAPITTLSGDLTVTGDDLTMGTNTSGAALIGDGTNFNPVVISGDISIGATGAAAIGTGVIVNADVSSSAAIADSKLATISTANKVGLAALDIDGGTDIGAAIVDADLFIIDDGAGGTNKKVTASRLKTYAQTGVSSAADDITTGNAAVTISTTSGAVTLDSPADVVLDADGADVKFKDGGTLIGTFTNSSSDFVITANVSDKDMIFKGNDGGTTVTALTFDMSNAGAASFNDDITVTGNDITFGNGESISNGTDGTVAVTATTTSVSGDLTVSGGDVNASRLYTNSVDITLDGAADIILDADGADITLKDGGTTFGSLSNSSGELVVKSGSTPTTALTFSGANVTAAGTVASGAITSSGIIKTDDATEATSTTDGSLQTDGGLSVAKDAVIGDDLKLLSDAAVLSFGADSEVSLTHVADTGVLLNSSRQLQFRDSALGVNSSADGQLDIDADTEVEITTTTVDLNGALDVSGTSTLAGAVASGAITSSGIIKTDDATEATSTTDGSLQTDGGLSVAKDAVIGDDLKLLSDSAVLGFGADSDVKITHDPDDGLYLKSTATTDDNPFLLTLQTGETAIEGSDVLGVINFQAPDEADGNNALLIGAVIEAVAEYDFTVTENHTKLVFKTASDAVAAERLSIGSSGLATFSSGATFGGDLTVTGNDITFGNSESISNSTNGTVKINGEVAAGTGSAAGVFKSNGNYDATLKTGNSTTGSITITDGSNGDITIAPNGTGETDFDGNPIANFSASTVSITSATTLASTHNGKVLICNKSSDFTLTIPEDTLPVGFNCLIVQIGNGEVTLAAASGNVTVNNRNSHTKTANTWAIMTLICIDATTDANVFVSSGDGTS